MNQKNAGAWIMGFVIVAIAMFIVMAFIFSHNTTGTPDPTTSPVASPTPAGNQCPQASPTPAQTTATSTVTPQTGDNIPYNSNPASTDICRLMDTTSWINALNERLDGYRKLGHQWPNAFHIESGKIKIVNWSLIAYDGDKSIASPDARTWSSKYEGRTPKGYIEDAPSFSIPDEITVNGNKAVQEEKDYTFCVILSDPVYGDEWAQHLNEPEYAAKNGYTIVQNDPILRSYLAFADKAYANVNRGNFTGLIYQEWLNSSWQPQCGWEAMRNPWNTEYISHLYNPYAGCFDYESFAVRLCQILQDASWKATDSITVKAHHHLVMNNYDPLRRSELIYTEHTARWIKITITLDSGDKPTLMKTSDLRLAHVNPTKPATPTRVPSESTTVPSNPDPTPTAPPESTATPVVTAEPTPTTAPTDEPTPTASPIVTAEPTPTTAPTPTATPVVTAEPTPTAAPTAEPIAEPTPTPHKVEEEKPDEEGNADVWGGKNDNNEGASSASPVPTVNVEAGESGQHIRESATEEPKVELTQEPPKATEAPVTATEVPVTIREDKPDDTPIEATPEPGTNTEVNGEEVWTPD